jgi:hypothetical protein
MCPVPYISILASLFVNRIMFLLFAYRINFHYFTLRTYPLNNVCVFTVLKMEHCPGFCPQGYLFIFTP